MQDFEQVLRYLCMNFQQVPLYLYVLPGKVRRELPARLRGELPARLRAAEPPELQGVDPLAASLEGVAVLVGPHHAALGRAPSGLAMTSKVGVGCQLPPHE